MTPLYRILTHLFFGVILTHSFLAASSSSEIDPAREELLEQIARKTGNAHTFMTVFAPDLRDPTIGLDVLRTLLDPEDLIGTRGCLDEATPQGKKFAQALEGKYIKRRQFSESVLFFEPFTHLKHITVDYTYYKIGQWESESPHPPFPLIPLNTPQTASVDHLFFSTSGTPALLGIQHLQNLKSIHLRAGTLVIPGLGVLTHLVKLDLAHNKLTSLEGVEELIHLKSLDIKENQLERLPSLSRLTKLRILSASGNRLVRVPGLEHLSRLSTLELERNRLEEFPHGRHFPKLGQLEGNCPPTLSAIFSLAHNNLSSLEGLDHLRRVGHLDLAYNRLSQLPGIENCTKLISLNLSHNHLTTGAFITRLTMLESLNIGHNPWETLPSFLSAPLTFLGISGLSLTSLAPLGPLSQSLRTLDLSDNLFSELSPLELGAPVTHLFLAGNQFNSVNSLTVLRQLKYVDLGDNPLQDISGWNTMPYGAQLALSQSQLDAFDLVFPIADRSRHLVPAPARAERRGANQI